ncbi:MAG TPA: copper transporter [Mycobacteriales bacterium]|jgi:hypothetical protein|nr:copper transporter [Mycobacteriales bacterium]
MVDFRYHLVSIIAVFLALALGIVIGTTALNGEILDSLKSSIGTLTAEKRNLEGSVTELRQQTATDQQLADRIGPAAVAGQLQGRRVVLVTLPNGSAAAADALVPLLQAAGATVTGNVQLRGDLIDPERAAAVDAVITQVSPGGLDGAGTETVQRASAELAAALVSSSAGSSISSSAADEVLAGFRDGNLIEADDDLGARAELAVLVAGDPVTSDDATVRAARARALLSFAAAFDAAGEGAVVAGPSAAAEEGGVVRALRDDGALSQRVSSVDGADQPQGRLVVVFALREQAEGGSGRYGAGPGAQAAVPSLPAAG